MVLFFEEKDRKAIEALGMSVIEYKRMIYKLTGAYTSIRQGAKRVINAVFDAVKRVVEQLKSVFRKIRFIEPRKRWKIVKPLVRSGISYTVFFPQHRVYHCRNNC